MRLSKRECVLLTVLAVMLIWYVGAGRILEPAAERRREAKGQLEQMEYRRTCVEKYLSKVGAGLGRDLAGEIPADDTGEFFLAELDDVAADRLLQDMAARAGVRIRKMEIGEVETFSEENEALEANQREDGEPSPAGDLVVKRLPVYLELNARTPGVIAGLAEQIDSSPDSMAVDYMEIKEFWPRATGGEAGSEVRCSMDVSFYWIERQQAGEEF